MKDWEPEDPAGQALSRHHKKEKERAQNGKKEVRGRAG